MKKLYCFYILLVTLCFQNLFAAKHYVGGDISLLPDYEAAKAKYFDQNGKPISDVLSFLHEEGMNAMRVRLFVNPGDFPNNDPNAKQDLDYIIPLCQRIKNQGFDLMLDFHYSDTWADPVKQWTPLAWQGLSNTELYQKIYDYTKETLETLKENGVVPDFIQTGNEISYGMLWGASNAPSSDLKKVYSNSETNWSYFSTLLKKAIQACNEVCPDAKIVLHNERVAKPEMLLYFYEQLTNSKYNVKYDIIGLSYYPYFHGPMTVLDKALTVLETNFPDKEIMVVETGYSYAWEVPGTDQPVDYPYSNNGQNEFAEDLVKTLEAHVNCTGLFWWWLEYNAYGTTLQNWYNAPLFDSRNGRATKALKTICGFNNDDSGVNDVLAVPSDCGDWFDLLGRPVSRPSSPGLYIHNRKVIVIP